MSSFSNATESTSYYECTIFPCILLPGISYLITFHGGTEICQCVFWCGGCCGGCLILVLRGIDTSTYQYYHYEKYYKSTASSARSSCRLAWHYFIDDFRLTNKDYITRVKRVRSIVREFQFIFISSIWIALLDVGIERAACSVQIGDHVSPSICIKFNYCMPRTNSRANFRIV